MTPRAVAIAACLLLGSPWPAALAAQEAAARSSAAAAPNARWQELETRLAQISQEVQGVVGVAVMDLATGDTILRLPDQVFAPASLIKIAVLAELYRQEQEAASGAEGMARLDDLYTVDAGDAVSGSGFLNTFAPGRARLTNRDLAVMMMAVSDNSAANVLIRRVGLENVNAMLRQLGLERTRLRRLMMDFEARRQGRDNTSTPREMLALLRALYADGLLRGELREDLLRVMAVDKQTPLTRGVTAGLRVASKSGTLEGVRNDAGIVFTKRPFAIVVMTANLADESAGEEAITRMAAAACAYFAAVAGNAAGDGNEAP